MTPADRLRSLRTAALARLIDPWADAWEDGRPPQPPRRRTVFGVEVVEDARMPPHTARLVSPRGSMRVVNIDADPLDVPVRPDDPTEEA